MKAALMLALALGIGSVPGDDGGAFREAFENLKRMAGSWSGKSSRGWTEAADYRILAGGSTVLELSRDAHPDESMATVFYLDGNELWLQHFCMAKNAPRMKATRIADGGKKIWFTFVDGVNIPDRSRGHMDSAYFEFHADRSVLTRWTWYQDAQERWMEDIVLTRTTHIE